MLGAVVRPVLGAGVPVKATLSLTFRTEKPVEASIHRLHLLLDDGVVDDSVSSGVVSLDRGGRLGPSHFDQCLTERDHFIGGDFDATKFSFRGGGHDKLDNLDDGENGSIVVREYTVF